jgi:hypothetical protein
METEVLEPEDND